MAKRPRDSRKTLKSSRKRQADRTLLSNSSRSEASQCAPVPSLPSPSPSSTNPLHTCCTCRSKFAKIISLQLLDESTNDGPDITWVDQSRQLCMCHKGKPSNRVEEILSSMPCMDSPVARQQTRFSLGQLVLNESQEDSRLKRKPSRRDQDGLQVLNSLIEGIKSPLQMQSENESPIQRHRNESPILIQRVQSENKSPIQRHRNEPPILMHRPQSENEFPIQRHRNESPIQMHRAQSENESTLQIHRVQKNGDSTLHRNPWRSSTDNNARTSPIGSDSFVDLLFSNSNVLDDLTAFSPLPANHTPVSTSHTPLSTNHTPSSVGATVICIDDAQSKDRGRSNGPLCVDEKTPLRKCATLRKRLVPSDTRKQQTISSNATEQCHDSNSSVTSEDDLFWTQVASIVDTSTVIADDLPCDDLIDDKTVDELFKGDDIDHSSSQPRVCSQQDIEAKRQQAKRKLQQKFKTI